MGFFDKIKGIFGKGVNKATTVIPGTMDDKLVQKAGEVAGNASNVAGTVVDKVQDVVPDSVEQKAAGVVSTAHTAVKQAAEVVADKIDAVALPGNIDNRVAGTLHDFSGQPQTPEVQSQNQQPPTQG